jgi:hypothetical protein
MAGVRVPRSRRVGQGALIGAGALVATGGERAVEGGQRLVATAERDQDLGADVPGEVVGRVEGNGAVDDGQCPCRGAFAQEMHPGAAVMGARLLRIEAQRRIEVGGSLPVLPQLEADEAASRQEVRIVRRQGDGSVIVGERLLEPLEPRVEYRPAGSSKEVVWIDCDRLGEVGKRAIGLAELGVGNRPERIGMRELRREADCLSVGFNGQRVVTDSLIDVAPTGIGAGIVRIEAEGLIEVRHGVIRQPDCRIDGASGGIEAGVVR